VDSGIFTAEVKYKTLSITIPFLNFRRVSPFAGLGQWNELWNGLKQNIQRTQGRVTWYVSEPGIAMEIKYI